MKLTSNWYTWHLVNIQLRRKCDRFWHFGIDCNIASQVVPLLVSKSRYNSWNFKCLLSVINIISVVVFSTRYTFPYYYIGPLILFSRVNIFSEYQFEELVDELWLDRNIQNYRVYQIYFQYFPHCYISPLKVNIFSECKFGVPWID